MGVFGKSRDAECQQYGDGISNHFHLGQAPDHSWLRTPSYARRQFDPGSISRLRSVFRHGAVDFVRPGSDAALDALEVLESLLAQELQGFEGTSAGLAVNIIGLGRVQLGDSLRQRAERDQPRAGKAGNLVFVRLAHVEDLDAELQVVERFLDLELNLYDLNVAAEGERVVIAAETGRPADDPVRFGSERLWAAVSDSLTGA